MKVALFIPLTLLFMALAAPVHSTAAVFTKFANRLPTGAIKTEPEIGIHNYEMAARAPRGLGSSEAESARCLNKGPGIYQRLCEDVIGSEQDFMLRKARFHKGWASFALEAQPRETTSPAVVREIERERRSDRELAKEALAALKRLENDVIIYSSLGDFEAEPKIARVSLETFQQHLRETVIEVRKILFWLPRNRLRAEISNALTSYQDGAFWWERTSQLQVISVGNLAAERQRTALDSAYAGTVSYIVVINWRNAARSIRRAEALL